MTTQTLETSPYEPLSPDYAQLPITEGFDWTNIIAAARQQHDLIEATPWYLVVFRSKLREGVDTTLLLEHDAKAHQAAQESPALLHYFGGRPDEEGRALSFCLWSDEAEAKSISRDSRHAAAVKMVSLYESYSVEKYDVRHEEAIVLHRKSPGS